LNLAKAIFLFFAGALGGAMNAVAGGGSFVAFPALLFTGVEPIAANATNTLSLWVGTVARSGAYRKRLNLPRRILIPLLLTSVIGGFVGAVLLVKTPAPTFLGVIPWLMFAATLLFTFGKFMTGRSPSPISGDAGSAALVGASLFELALAVYGGYFGGGLGIVNLAMLSALGMTDINAMNALKVLLGGVINGVATITFVVSGATVWPQAVVMVAGAVLGGFSAAHIAQKLPQKLIRALIIAIGSAMTVYFFWHTNR
jgi:uncharacterized membrane protein YfcA